MGSLGVLHLAKQKGLITTIRPLLAKLRYSDIFVSEHLLNRLLVIANEEL
jgi:predicted nucleic acid-binding protein